VKKIISLIHLIVVILLSAPSSAQDGGSAGTTYLEIQDAMIFPFFMALTNGDVGEFKKYFSKEMYNENRRLLEENTEYPQFLRSYYQGANISILKAIEVDGEVEFDVLIEFPNGTQSISKLIASEETNGDDTIHNKKKWSIISMESIR
jgi:hypothetical protein